ncbi:FAD-dependent oxidoreductase [Verminephrobacter aporrectodeae subsp. tuberculatae]|uniref:NADH:flavin oxidoreductase n=1 Tax=Verminephrobacter aporrectodeae TaxID=1110389 RepID=UPI002244B36D|nr:NADH:flavin oxidoreductase [Verminephrobacter aporrectodeae]MCW8209098.1 FAD-dependent oxidoreductase [Verminephrobacter aporrectodeae subsp. tuberculatae]
MRYPHLFEPLRLNQLLLRNRIVSTAHAEVYGRDGVPTPRYIRYYEEKARGGVGLVICGGSSPVSRDSPWSWWSSINLTRDAVVEPLSRLAETMHRHGAKLMIQATHMGRRNAWGGFDWPHLVSPSGIREPVHRGNAKTIEVEEIRRIVADFGRAAKRVQDAGLDGIEISAAHQHLIDQFWSPRVNQRSDEYGGSLENRLRFGMQVLEAVREQVGADFCVGLRVSADEFHEDGIDHEVAKEIAQAMSESGLIDFLDVVGSGADTHNTLANCMPPMALPPEPFVHLAAGIKSVSRVPVLHAQGIRDAAQAERILAAGMVDLVGMTRAQIADPHMVVKIRDGREDQIKQCVGANYCIDRQYKGLDVLCIQNAATGREQSMPQVLEKSTGVHRKVVVVGAGPAGLEAARVARARGHEVLLFEQAPAVGGQVNLAAKAPQREQMAGIIRWFDMETRRLGVQRRLGVTADVAMVLAEAPDIVVLATGGVAHTGQTPAWGAAQGLCVSSWDILSGAVAPGENVLVYDSIGAHAGTGVADFIATRGKQVEIVTPDAKVADDVGGTTFPIFYRQLYAKGVIQTPNCWLEKVYLEGDKRIAVLKNEYTEALEERAVDQVVLENGVLPNDGLYWQLKPLSLNQGQTDIDALYDAQAQPGLSLPTGDGDFLLYRVGDCVSMHDIHGAIYDALRLCKDF